MAKKATTKHYTLGWFSPLDGEYNFRRSVTTNNPKHALFNFACEMIVTAGNILGTLKHKNIMRNIQTGHTNREHYYMEFSNDEVLSIMEDLKQ